MFITFSLFMIIKLCWETPKGLKRKARMETPDKIMENHFVSQLLYVTHLYETSRMSPMIENEICTHNGSVIRVLCNGEDFVQISQIFPKL